MVQLVTLVPCCWITAFAVSITAHILYQNVLINYYLRVGRVVIGLILKRSILQDVGLLRIKSTTVLIMLMHRIKFIFAQPTQGQQAATAVQVPFEGC